MIACAALLTPSRSSSRGSTPPTISTTLAPYMSREVAARRLRDHAALWPARNQASGNGRRSATCAAAPRWTPPVVTSVPDVLGLLHQLRPLQRELARPAIALGFHRRDFDLPLIDRAMQVLAVLARRNYCALGGSALPLAVRHLRRLRHRRRHEHLMEPALGDGRFIRIAPHAYTARFS